MATNFPTFTSQRCTHCGTNNQPMAMICNECFQILPPENIADLNDWVCINCNTNNDVSLQLCQLCQQEKWSYQKSSPHTNGGASYEVLESKSVAMRKLKVQLEQIRFQCIQNNTKFTDSEFPANLDSVSRISAEFRSHVKSFRRPNDVVVEEDDRGLPWTLFNEPKMHDIVQGRLGDCWIINSISLVAERPKLLTKIFADESYNAQGVYGIQLCVDGKWVNVIVDDIFPCDANGQLIFTKARRKQLFAPILEKALAKVFKSYSGLRSGLIANGLEILTGNAVESFSIVQMKDKVLEREKLFNNLQSKMSSGLIVSCATATTKHVSDIEFEAIGLLSRHSYAVISARTILFTKLLLLRNIWGRQSWNGDWSEHSPCWNNLSLAFKPPEGIGDARNGIFWISLDDFFKYFGEVVICYVRDNWNEYRVPCLLPCVCSPKFQGIQLKIEDNVTLDLNIQHKLNRSDLFEVIMMIFDESSNLIGSADCKLSSRVAWCSNFLLSGLYTIYIFSRSRLSRLVPTEIVLVCHSNREIGLETIEHPILKLTSILFKFISTIGTSLRTRNSMLYEYHLKNPHWLGTVIAVRNFDHLNSYIVETKSTLTENVSPSRPEPTKDIIAPHCSQILQMFTWCNMSMTDGYDLQIQTHSRKASNNDLQQTVPAMCLEQQIIHRAVCNL